MTIYRVSRNIEASLIEHIQAELASALWTGISVEKTFSRIYEIPVNTFQKQGAICIRLEDTTHQQAQIGDDSTVILPLVLIDIFATSDGQRLDLKDFIVSTLKNGLSFYEYQVSGDSVSSRTLNGRIRITNMEDTPVNFGVEKSLLNVHDRYRHLISLTISLGRVEV